MSSDSDGAYGRSDRSSNGIVLLARVLRRAIDISSEHERTDVNAGTLEILEQALDEQVATPDDLVRVWAVLQLGTFAAKKVVVRKHNAMHEQPEERQSQAGDSAGQN